MLNSTLCYIEQNGCYLMLRRVKKVNDVNQGKWIGVGGKFEEGESADDCLLREVREETGLTLTSYRFRGVVTFDSDRYETEQMFLYTADGFRGSVDYACPEGELAWIPKTEIDGLELWEGDRVFLKLISEDAPVFLLKLTYKGDTLTESKLSH